MIKLLESPSVMSTFKVNDAFAVRVIALLNAYGTGATVDFWYQEGSEVTAIISRSGGAVTVSATSDADLSEIGEFIRVVGYTSVEGTATVLEGLGLGSPTTGLVLQCTAKDCEGSALKEQPLLESLKVLECAGTIITSEVYTDFSHRVRHGSASYASTGTSTALLVAIAGDGAVLGGVATLQEFRHKGQATAVVKRLLSSVAGSTVYTLIEREELLDFYKRFGFEKFDYWGVIYA